MRFDHQRLARRRRKMLVSISELARLAGVSQTTASRLGRPGESFTERTAERVLEALSLTMPEALSLGVMIQDGPDGGGSAAPEAPAKK
jgi:predicted transcriptional regulator